MWDTHLVVRVRGVRVGLGSGGDGGNDGLDGSVDGLDDLGDGLEGKQKSRKISYESSGGQLCTDQARLGKLNMVGMDGRVTHSLILGARVVRGRLGGGGDNSDGGGGSSLLGGLLGGDNDGL
jgi:hypothetical protein